MWRCGKRGRRCSGEAAREFCMSNDVKIPGVKFHDGEDFDALAERTSGA
jgi:hypothetical protein